MCNKKCEGGVSQKGSAETRLSVCLLVVRQDAANTFLLDAV